MLSTPPRPPSASLPVAEQPEEAKAPALSLDPLRPLLLLRPLPVLVVEVLAVLLAISSNAVEEAMALRILCLRLIWDSIMMTSAAVSHRSVLRSIAMVIKNHLANPTLLTRVTAIARAIATGTVKSVPSTRRTKKSAKSSHPSSTTS
jgi:hypothetical protein